MAGVLMAHCISNDIHADPLGHHAIFGGMAQVVDPLPGVAEIIIASRRACLQRPSNAASRRPFVGDALHQCRDSRHLDHTVEIELLLPTTGIKKVQVEQRARDIGLNSLVWNPGNRESLDASFTGGDTRSVGRVIRSYEYDFRKEKGRPNNSNPPTAVGGILSGWSYFRHLP